jgi:hypothetical protein
MKRVLLASAAVVALSLGASAPSLAQGVGVQVGPIGAGISFAPEQRTRIKEYVVKERVAPVAVRERVRVGAVLPEEVELRAVPSDWGPEATKYRYVYVDNHVYFVEPSSRKIVYEID